jgi:hypothetical protein|tara:strand:+ start:1479 stop:1688 length:210 start_codon:yes stop_codon:yes gene_type:complete
MYDKDKKRKPMAYGREAMRGGGKNDMYRMPKGHGGESKKSGDYSSISDMEKDCNRRVGYNESLKSKEDK